MLSDQKTALQKHLDAVMKRNEEGDYITIHLACKYWFPDEVLKCVIDANVEMAKEKDNEDLYPLQIECCENGKPCSIAHVIQIHPEAASVMDKDGDSPLHRSYLVAPGPPDDHSIKALLFSIYQLIFSFLSSFIFINISL